MEGWIEEEIKMENSKMKKRFSEAMKGDDKKVQSQLNSKGTEYIAEAVMERGRKMEKWKTPRPGKDREEKRRDEKR